MEVIKKNINVNHVCGKADTQITLNDDFNVADDKPDIYKKITDNGEITVENVKASDDKAQVTGCLKFSMLYQADYGSKKANRGTQRAPFAVIEGELDFSESVNVPGLSAGDNVKAAAAIDDLTITIVNSRKISVSAVVSLNVYGENSYAAMAVTDIEDEGVCVLRKNIDLLAQLENKKDILRIREQYELPTNKPNMGNIIWGVKKLRNVEIKPATDEMIVKGDIYIFAMYETEDMTDSIQSLETELPFVGKLPMSGVTEGMIADVGIEAAQSSISIKPDYDGEPRMLECEMVLDLDIKIYEEQSISLVNDIYSVNMDVKPSYSSAGYDRLLIRNHTRCRAGSKFKVDDKKDRILQLINSSGVVNIDDVMVDDSGIMVEGAVKVNIMYISSNDEERIGCLVKEIPFSQHIDAPGIKENSFYNVRPELEQLSVMMLGGDELEVKLVVGLNALVLDPMEVNVITDIEECPLDYNMLKKMPGIYGHIVKENESMWDIAKNHYTTVEKIMDINGLSSENVKPGMKLLIVKNAVQMD